MMKHGSKHEHGRRAPGVREILGQGEHCPASLEGLARIPSREKGLGEPGQASRAAVGTAIAQSQGMVAIGIVEIYALLLRSPALSRS
jgi:hypothetical protein